MHFQDYFFAFEFGGMAPDAPPATSLFSLSGQTNVIEKPYW